MARIWFNQRSLRNASSESLFFLVPTPWAVAAGWDNDKTDPLGVAHFTIRVLDCKEGVKVFEREFTTDKHYANSTLAEGAKRAMDEALQNFPESFRLLTLGRSVPEEQADGAELSAEEPIVQKTDDREEPVENQPAVIEPTDVDLDVVPVTIKYDSRFPNTFSIALAIDGHEDIALEPDSETTKQFSRGQYLIKIVDPKRGMFHKPDWDDYEFTLDLESLSEATILIKSQGFFRVSITVLISSEGNEAARYKIKPSM